MVLVCLVWGLNYSISKQALQFIAPLPFAAIRFALSTALLFALVRRAEPEPQPPVRTKLIIAGLGLVGHTLNQLAFLGGLQYTSATNSSLIFASLPVVVAVLSTLSGTEATSRRVWLGVGLGTGVAIVVGSRGAHFDSLTIKGDLLTLAAVLFWATFTVGIHRVAKDVSPLRLTAWTHAAGMVGLWAVGIPSLRAVAWHSLGTPVWGAIVYSALFSSMVASFLWIQGVKHLGSSRTALYNCLTPIFAAVAAGIIFGERLVPLQALGAVLVVGGVLVSQGAFMQWLVPATE